MTIFEASERGVVHLNLAHAIQFEPVENQLNHILKNAFNTHHQRRRNNVGRYQDLSRSHAANR